MAIVNAQLSSLLAWLNALLLHTVICSAVELSDGFVLWEILEEIDPQYFFGRLPAQSSSGDSVWKWQNLRHLEKLMKSYIRARNNDVLPAGLEADLDLKAVAECVSDKATCELLSLLVFAAINSPKGAHYIATMETLPIPVLACLMGVMQEAENPSPPPLEEISREHVECNSMAEMDPVLRSEERVSQVIAASNKLSSDKIELEKQVESLGSRLSGSSGYGPSPTECPPASEQREEALFSKIRYLDNRIQDQEDFIASQEETLGQSHNEIDNLQSSVASLLRKTKKLEQLEDENESLRSERDRLADQADMAQQYQQRLYRSQGRQAENAVLKARIQDLLELAKENDANKELVLRQEAELKELRQHVTNAERDGQQIRKQLEFDSHVLSQHLASSEEHRIQSESTIHALQERMEEMEAAEQRGVSGATTPGAPCASFFDMESGQRELNL